MTPAEKPPLDRTRDWIKYHLIPVNNLILFTGFVVAALDTAAPVARPYTKVLTTIAATGAVLLILTSVLPAKGLQAFLREKRWTLWLGFLATFACAGFVSVAHGDQGLLASGSGRWPISRARSSTSMPRSRPSSKRRPRFVPTPRSFARSPKPRS